MKVLYWLALLRVKLLPWPKGAVCAYIQYTGRIYWSYGLR